MSKYIIALDQGTTSSRAVLFNETLTIIDMCQKEFTQYYPDDGQVEHDPNEIWESQQSVLLELIQKQNISPGEILSIGITNQRETTIVWNRHTGEPIYNAIVWQDRRTASLCDTLKASQKNILTIQQKTGLVIDAYFSATKLQWLLDTVPDARAQAENGDLLFGTIDTWLLWKLTNGAVHMTDVTNASRTMLFNIEELCWDTDILELLHIPASMLPEVKPSAYNFGSTIINHTRIPITAIAGDQQAATFGQCCFEPGMVKNTYGTGCFMVMNTGHTRIKSSHGLLTTIAWQIGNEVWYALEGSVFIAGAAIQWLRDEMKFLSNAAQSEQLTLNADVRSKVVVVPAFTGLGAPHWDMYARGAILGITRDTGREEITKATIESIALQNFDLFTAMEKDSGITIHSLTVDGGACSNNYLMQYQSDILARPIIRPANIESTALGAAALAGLQLGLWNTELLSKMKKKGEVFEPRMSDTTRAHSINQWHRALKAVRSFHS